MPRRVSGTGIIQVPFGHPSQFSIYINNVEYTGNIDSWSFTERLNYMSTFTFHIYGVNSSSTDVQKEKLVKFFSQSNVLFVGKIIKVDYGSYNDATVSGNKIAEVNLNRNLISTLASATGTSGRQQYDSINSSTQVTEICGSDVTVGTNTNYGQLSMRYENINKLASLDALAKATNQEYLCTAGSYPFETATFSIDNQIGSTSSVYTFNIGGATQNVITSNKTIDTQNLVNSITVNGYGDGVNQVSATITAASNIYSLLSANITASATSLTLNDASSFATSGKVSIANEIVAYTGKSSNTLTGCTRGSTDATAVATTAKKHNKGCLVFEYYDGATYYTKTSPKTGSSIQANGLCEKTYSDPTLIFDTDKVSCTTAELNASRMIFDYMNPIERITMMPSNLHDVSEKVTMGDTITHTDSNAGLSGTYRVMGRTIGLGDDGWVYNLELSNIPLTYLQEMNTLKQSSDSVAMAAQGSTIIFNASNYENCDANYPLNMRFLIPTEAIAINKALLRFKIKNYRGYESTTASGGSSTPTSSGGSEASKTSSANSAISQNSASTGAEADEFSTGWEEQCSASGFGTTEEVIVKFNVQNVGSGGSYFSARVYNGTSYYPSSEGFGDYVEAGNSTSFVIHVTGNMNGKTLSMQAKSNTSSITVDWNANFIGKSIHTHDTNLTTHTHTVTISAHTHGMSAGIYENSVSTPSVVVVAGTEGAETSVGTYTSDPTSDIDISTQVKAAGVGNWCNIKFTPNQAMRIEANAYIQAFIESK